MGTCAAGRLKPVTRQVNAMVVRKPRSYLFVTRSHTTNVLSEVGGQPQERDDSESIMELAEQLAKSIQDRQVQGTPAIPWIETGYALGDRITEIRGRQLRFATARGAGARYPAVLERRFTLRDGVYETVLTLGVTDLPAEAV